ncbi:Cas4 nuclease superfamily protein [Stenotrophomonas phage A1432]|uniref:Cas4 nuclease superfamily protein n=1 Tax=Stenotrophomonas phage A1432 TaxID=2930315 RepID=A0A9E7N191_9CAUD|nr:Cas4 nuclease superfamily protein [Stenotrophomonas phage A1432]UTC28017.1 Cas4 nuclease superfamily protein [Stenotrophomonas phage A1432]
MPSAHAVRNASGAKRWMNCLGSIKMEHGRPNNSSPAARLGTAAHALGEACLLDQSDTWEWLGGFVRLDPSEQALVVPPNGGDGYKDGVLVPVHATMDGLPPSGHEDFPIDADMADAVQVYLEAVRDEVDRLGAEHAELQVEKRFSLNWLIGYDFDEAAFEKDPSYISPSGIHFAQTDEFPEGHLFHMNGNVCWGPMFGTNDASVIQLFDHVTIFDYKHGQGVVVEVEDNDQEQYYALGCANELDWAFETLDLVIVQPRARHVDGKVRRWSTDKATLRAFEKRLREAAFATEQPDAPLKAGDWCTFCKAAGVCSELREESYRQAGLEFGDGFTEDTVQQSGIETTDEELMQRMRALPLLNIFIKSTATEAMRRLRETPGGQACYGKLVRKKSNRAFRTDLTDDVTGEPLSAIDFLAANGIPREEMYAEPKQLSPSQIEKLRPPELIAKLKADGVRAPAAHIKNLVAEVSHKPEGGITFAGLDDPREAVDATAAAESDFAVFDGEESTD